MDWMDATIAADGRGYVTAAAVNLVMSAREDPATRAAVLGATLAVPDGQPLVWALKALGHARATRVYGPDLMAHYCARAAARGDPDVPLRRAHPGGAGAAAGAPARAFPRPAHRRRRLAAVPRAERGRRSERALAAIDDSGAQVVWVGTGQPKQELWMHRVRPHLRAPLLVGVGAAFDFHAGLVPQAPPWMGRHGLEWTYRLAREPRRLWRRYARYNPRFVAGFAAQYARERRSPRQPN